MRRALLSLLLIAAPATAQAPRPGTLRTFDDWIVGCDNVRRCQAVALAPPGDSEDGDLRLVVARGGGGADRPVLTVQLDARPAGPLALRVDGRPVARLTLTAGDLATTVLDRARAAALAGGASAALGGASASLRGLAAAMLYMDAQQRRVGTVGSLRRAGRASDRTVVAPATPRIVAPPPGTAPPRTMTEAAATAAIGRDATGCADPITPIVPEAHRLDRAHSLVLVDHPCGNGAYNLYTSVFVLDAAGRARPAAFDAPVEMGETDLVSGGWDAKDRRLTSYARGRGLGDCGVRQSYAWDGARFRLVEQAEMGECRGSIDYIVTWQAQVLQR